MNVFNTINSCLLHVKFSQPILIQQLDLVQTRLTQYQFCRGRPNAEVLLSAENRNRKSIVSEPKPSASLMPAYQGPQATIPDADVDSAASFLSYLYIVSQYTVRLMTPCVWRILCLRNSSSVVCTLLSASTEFTNSSTPKPKVHRMWYDSFRPKPNVRRKCPFVHIRRRNRNRSRNSVDLYNCWTQQL